MKIKIMVDSCSYFTKEELLKYDIAMLNLIIVTPNDNKTIEDTEENWNKYNLFDINKNHAIKTSQINSQSLENSFTKILSEYDEIIYFPIPFNLSSQYSTAYMVSQRPEFKNKVHVIKSNAPDFLARKKAIFASELVKKGKTVEEILEITQKWNDLSRIIGIPGDIKRLAKGGRATKILKAHILSWAKIKIAIEWGDKPQKVSISRTIKKCLEDIEKHALKYIRSIKKEMDITFLSHPLCDKNILLKANKFIEDSIVDYKKFRIANIYTTHSTFNTIGIAITPKNNSIN